MFSRRSGTVADTMENQISEDIKKDRIHRLLGLSKSITKQKNSESIGKEFNVMAVNNTEHGYETLSDSGKTVYVNSNLQSGEFYHVRITKIAYNRLYAELVKGN